MSEEFDQFDPGEPANEMTAEGIAVEAENATLEQTLEQAFDQSSGEGDSPKSTTSPSPDDNSQAEDVSSQSTDAKEANAQDTDKGEKVEDLPEAGLKHWPQEQRQAFGKMPQDQQDFFMQRYKEMEAGHTRRSQEMAPLRDLMSDWQPYLGQLQAQGVIPNPIAAINGLLGLEQQLRTGDNARKVAILTKLALDYGVQTPGEDEAREDPSLHQMELQMRNQQAQMRRMQYQQMDNNTAFGRQQISQFVAEKTADGKPAYPYFNALTDDMVRLAQADVNSGISPNLRDLYERASWNNPKVRAELLKSQVDTQLAERQANLDKKRNASSSVAGNGSVPISKKSDDLNAIIAEGWDRFM